MNNNNESTLDQSSILDFYAGKTLFITGFSGFLGKVLVEKILRCIDVKRVYVLLRGKRGLSPAERLKQILNKQPFTFHDKTVLNAYKVVAVEGDLGAPNLGIDQKTCDKLIEEVNVVLHCAADVRFDADLESNLVNNVKGTEYLIDLCHQFAHLEAMVHVSTAYSFCDRLVIEEKVYPMEFGYDEVENVLKSPDAAFKKKQTEKFLAGRPNPYTLTKALGEDLVMKKRGNIPTSIVRPSIVISSVNEPAPGWVDTIQGIQGIGLAAQIGLLQTVDWNYWAAVDTIAVDICANFIIASAWYSVCKKPNECMVYNLTAGAFHPEMTWGGIFELAREAAYVYPSKKQLRPLMAPPKYKRARFYYPLEKFLYHTFFAILLDMIISLFGYKRFLYKQACRLNKGLDLVVFFTTHEFKIKTDRYLELVDSLSPKDYKLFYCDVRKFNFSEYIVDCVKGFKKYFLKEDEADIASAKKQVMIVCALYRFIQLMFLGLIGKYLFSLGCYLLSTTVTSS